MSLKHAILGFLNYAPHSGYDLKATFDMSVQHFWPADQSQIYRTLGAMADKGWVTVEVIEQDERPDRKVYHITEEGREKLRRWLTAPLPPSSVRNAELIQVFFAAQLEDEQILAIFEQQAANLRALLEHNRPFDNPFGAFVEKVSPRDAFFWGLTFENGIAIVESQLAWLESVIARIRSGQVPPKTQGGA